MGVRLMRFDKKNILGGPETNINDHDELVNRDLLNQHPIYSITGLQEVLNTLEDTDFELSNLLIEIRDALNARIDALVLDINSINQAITTITTTIANLNVVDNVEDTYSIDLDYNKDTNTLKADLRVYQDKDDTNAVQVLTGGLYVPKTITEETSSVKWAEISLGETLAEIYQKGMKFSHASSSWNNIYSSTEANAWYWDDARQSFVQPKNTSYFTGFVTENFYDYYTHTVTLRSTDSDNDVNGVVIGFVFDENGNPHTLSALCTRNGISAVTNWALIYDFYLPDQQVLFKAGNGAGGTVPSGGGSNGWTNTPNGIAVRVTKHKNIITAACSNWNAPGTINEATTITINLDDYGWGHLFKGAVRYGYCNLSQAYSFFQDIEFHSENAASASKFLATVKLSQELNNEIIIRDDGLYAPKFIIDSDATNALKKNANGYYVEAFRVSPDAYNMLTKRANGYYVEAFHTSAAVNNAIVKNADGYFVQKFLISAKEDNALKQESDGYFTQAFKISAAAENCLEQKADGYYVREQANVRSVLQSSHGFAVGDFIYYHPQNKYKKALAKDDYDSNIVGMVTKVTDANTFEYQPGGFFKTNLFNTARGFMQGMPLYISDVDAGKVTQVQPDISKAVGYPVEDIGIVISIERGIQYNQEHLIGDFKTSANNYNVRSDGFIRVVEDVEYRVALVQKLLDTLADDFKTQYVVISNDVVRFVDVENLYIAQKVPYGLHLFIKAF